MVTLGTIVVAAFLLGVVAFSVGIVWESLRRESHSPRALQPTPDDAVETDGG
jgi:hypothetical protein